MREFNHSDIHQTRIEEDSFRKVKPEEGMTIERARGFWDNLFSREIVSKSDISENKSKQKERFDNSESDGEREFDDAHDEKKESEAGKEAFDNRDASDSNDAANESGEIKELTEDEINEMQQKVIKEAFERIARGEKLADAEKGNLGEMLMDQYYIYSSKEYTPIHKPRVTDLEHKSGQGIDGVYEKNNPDGTKSYVIVDAKVNSSKLNKGLADGTDQMSDAWIDKRLDNAVGKEKADEIRDAYEDDPDSVSKEVYHFSYGDSDDGTSFSDISTVDDDGTQNKDKILVQVFDKYGNEIGGGEVDDKR